MLHACQLIMSLKAYIFNTIGTKACIYIFSYILHTYLLRFLLIPKF